MEISLTPLEQTRLASMATQAGFDSVDRFVAEHVAALACEPLPEEIGRLSPEALRESLAMCDLGMRQAQHGLAIPVDESRQAVAGRLERLESPTSGPPIAGASRTERTDEEPREQSR
ncbi:hypothetical protein Pla175_52020 [Pirellulimonas nuda]|uniref:Uncharacterized protein n=1 Tax=Pirellulimonas nuda TaxID=2528009 RepID=A0A518DJW7_9BACT|nr:hypothetical protein [Pirellulimonas nuda]QDU91771.1 hypothetical protein Pla175_52020 [Pirellulimonas nuda]